MFFKARLAFSSKQWIHSREKFVGFRSNLELQENSGEVEF